ncbi:MAG TPA: universal stress protein [Bacteroidia bacterium]|jgi:nucleotide-binding universal stress UspA family protein|nr:universal stress protein [Bacteroidia bacterium]HQF28114.1 universal stress protein [Bacteroidia bacterium]HQK97232.1 universal stress protein [Bacteroidia bacterium]
MCAYQNHIVIPIDFSEQCLIALNQTYNLARLTKSDITLLHVIDGDMFSAMISIFGDKEEKEKIYREGISVELEKLANEARAKSGLEIKTRIEKGKIYDCVNEVATELEAAFIVMGTSGASTLKKKMIGSNAVRVIGEAPCPVITIKGKEHTKGCNTIVLPLDLSKETKEKVGKCIEIATFFNSSVKVMSIVDTDDEFFINKLTRQMNQVLDFLQNSGIKCTGEFIKDDDIAEGVLKYADKVNADLIIIMTQQELEFTDFFIGTASAYIINNSEIPVCSIRPMERKDTTEYVI